MRSGTEQKLTALHQRNRKLELNGIFRESRANAVLAFTRQTIEDLAKQPPQQTQDLDDWFARLCQNFKLLATTNTPYTLQQAGAIYQYVLQQQSLNGFQLLVWVVKFAGEQAISDMIDQNLVGLLLKTIQSANVLAVDYAVEALAGLAAKGQGYRDFVLFNRCFEIVEERVQKNCLSVDLQSLLFQELMIYPFEKNGSDTASQLLKKHMPMLLNESCNLEPLFHGLCNSLLWEEKWVVDLLEDKNIYALVEEVGRTRSLKDSEIRWMMYLLALVGSKSTKEWKPMEKTLVRMCRIFALVLQLTRPGDSQQAQHHVLFVLQQIYSDSSMCKELCKAVREGLLEVLVTFIVESHNREECGNAVEVIYNMANCLELEDIAQEVVKAKLVECLKNRLLAHQLHTKDHLSVMLEILDLLTDEPCLTQHLYQQQLRRFLEALYGKLSDFDLRETITEILNRLNACE